MSVDDEQVIDSNNFDQDSDLGLPTMEHTSAAEQKHLQGYYSYSEDHPADALTNFDLNETAAAANYDVDNMSVSVNTAAVDSYSHEVEFVLHGVCITGVGLAGLVANVVCLLVLRQPALKLGRQVGKRMRNIYFRRKEFSRVPGTLYDIFLKRKIHSTFSGDVGMTGRISIIKNMHGNYVCKISF